MFDLVCVGKQTVGEVDVYTFEQAPPPAGQFPVGGHAYPLVKFEVYRAFPEEVGNPKFECAIGDTVRLPRPVVVDPNAS